MSVHYCVNVLDPAVVLLTILHVGHETAVTLHNQFQLLSNLCCTHAVIHRREKKIQTPSHSLIQTGLSFLTCNLKTIKQSVFF